MGEPAEVPDGIVARLRAVCGEFPEVVEERAWRGTRWRIRQRTFAHVLEVEGGNPRSYAEAAGTDGPATVLTFRSAGPELAALGHAGHPFFKPVWSANVVGLVLDDDTDWDEVAELLTESYCAFAPRKLVELLRRPV